MFQHHRDLFMYENTVTPVHIFFFMRVFLVRIENPESFYSPAAFSAFAFLK